MSFFSDFLHGFLTPFYGARLILRDSHLRTLSVFPMLISLVVGSILLIWGLYGLAQIIGSIALDLGRLAHFEPGGFLMLGLTILLWPLGLLVLGVCVYMGVRILAAPFYSFIAERALVFLGARKETNLTWRSIVQFLWLSLRLLVISLLRSAIFAVASVLLFIFSLIPILNVFAALGYMLMIAFDISDYSFEVMEWSLARRFRHVRDHIVTYTGFACGLGVVMLIPGLILLLLPAVVAGASETLHRTTAPRSADRDFVSKEIL